MKVAAKRGAPNRRKAPTSVRAPEIKCRRPDSIVKPKNATPNTQSTVATGPNNIASNQPVIDENGELGSAPKRFAFIIGC